MRDVVVGRSRAVAASVLVVAAASCGRLGFEAQVSSDAGAEPDAAPDASTRAVTWASGHGKHMCAVLTDGRGLCAGADGRGQLGDGPVDSTGTVPVEVAGDLRFVATTIGDVMSCGAGVDGTAWCWGADIRGRLGNGAAGDADAPSQVLGLPAAAIDVCAGTDHACALVSGGDVHCWGGNPNGALGIAGPDLDRAGAPVELGGAAARQIACGLFHSCAITVAGDLHCWGSNSSGQIGPELGMETVGPTRVVTGTARAVGAGQLHTCALASDGAVTCWGADDLGQHGDGAELGGTGPSQALLPEPAVALVSAQLHSCAIGASGAVYCWGSNVAGQVTGAAASDFEATPQQIALSRPAVAIGAHELATCASLDGGELLCWGEFAGQVGTLRWELP